MAEYGRYFRLREKMKSSQDGNKSIINEPFKNGGSVEPLVKKSQQDIKKY